MPIKPDKYSKLTEAEREEVEEVWIKNPTHPTLSKFWEANKRTMFDHIRRRVIKR